MCPHHVTIYDNHDDHDDDHDEDHDDDHDDQDHRDGSHHQAETPHPVMCPHHVTNSFPQKATLWKEERNAILFVTQCIEGMQ